MKANWSDLDPSAWNQAHAALCGPLQQDWAYGSTMRALGVSVLRASVSQAGTPVALAQLLVRRWAGVLSVAPCNGATAWSRPKLLIW